MQRLLVCLPLIFLAACNLFSLFQEEGGSFMEKDIQLQGTITEEIFDCAFDSFCAYIVDSDSLGPVKVIWSTGRPRCEGSLAPDLKIGDKISVFGRQISPDQVSICAQPDYYIRLQESSPFMEQNIQLQGIITGQIFDCIFDGICAYMINSETLGPVTVIWATGMLRCEGILAPDLQIGDKINVFGRQISPDEISICAEPDYYIRIPD